MASKPIMQFKAELMDAHIPIWRRFQVMDDVRFSRLAYILMTLFEMQASHLFAFDIHVANNIRKRTGDDEIAKERLARSYEDEGMAHVDIQMPIEDDWIADAQADMGTPVKDATKEYVKWQISHIGDEFTFEYDFGDGWDVRLTLEEVFEDENLSGKELPRVIEGEGFGIIEDCGGVDGLEKLDKAFKMGQGESYEEYCEWLGVDNVDLATFDIEDMNFRLKKVPRIFCDLYEKGLVPTQQSIDILERNYK